MLGSAAVHSNAGWRFSLFLSAVRNWGEDTFSSLGFGAPSGKNTEMLL